MKSTRSTWSSWVGRCFLIAAGLLSLAAVGIPLLHNWTPLIFPLPLARGTVATPQFRVDLNTSYDINLDLERKIDYHRLNCLLGVKEFFLKPCSGTEEVVDIYWKVFEGDKVVTEGNSSQFTDGYWGPTIGRTIGRFRGRNHGHYYLVLSVNRDATELSVANPKIKIETRPSLYRSYFDWAWASGRGALGCLLIALLVFLTSFVVRQLPSLR